MALDPLKFVGPIGPSSVGDTDTTQKKKKEDSITEVAKEKVPAQDMPGSLRELKGKVSTSEGSAKASKEFEKAVGIAGEVKEIKKAEDNLSARSGSLWDCVEKIEDESGRGSIYKYKAKDECNLLKVGLKQLLLGEDLDPKQIEMLDIMQKAIAERQKSSFPAVEPYLSEVTDLLPPINESLFQAPSLVDRSKLFTLIKELGFGFGVEGEDFFMYLPDAELLMARSEEVNVSQPEIPKLDILTVNGIIPHKQFVKNFLDHDVMISKEEGFVHDTLRHAYPTLEKMVELGPKFKDWRNGIRSQVEDASKRIAQIEEMIANKQIPEDSPIAKNLKFIEAGLSVFCDEFPGGRLFMDYKKENHLDEHYKTMWEDPQVRDIFIKEFGDNIDFDQLPQFWEEIKKLTR